MTTFTTEDRINASPPHIVDSGASVMVKDLTDEEIAEVFDNTFKVRDFDDAFLKFARAILKKAQEK